MCRLLLCARYLKGGSRERGVQNILVSCGLRGACENSVVVDAGVGGASIGAMLTPCGFFPAESSKDRCRGAPGREGHGAVDLEDLAEDLVEAPGHRYLVAPFDGAWRTTARRMCEPGRVPSVPAPVTNGSGARRRASMRARSASIWRVVGSGSGW